MHSGEFQVVNHHLIKDLAKLGMWDDDMRNEIIADYGSIQNITRIPKDIRDLYKTVWEVSVKTTMNMAADRGAFIDQSQSFNVHIAQPNYAKMSSMHFYAWKLGLKTGMYYLRTRPAANPIQFTVDKERLAASRALNKPDGDTSMKKSQNGEENGDIEHQMAALTCSLNNKDDCMMCGA